MPANRSRTQEWRRCLEQIASRNGAIEVAVARQYEDGSRFPDLMWRVRLLSVGDREIVVEQPVTMGQTIQLQSGVDLVAIISIGQNRWMFATRNLGAVNHKLNPQKSLLALRLLMPESVQRCQRRGYYRIDTAAINLPRVELWPLLEPSSVVLAERANEVGIGPETKGSNVGASGDDPSFRLDMNLDTMPEVGPEFKGTLMNIGGGGVGLLIRSADASVLHNHKLYWLRITLPELSTPICATGKLVHSHRESSQDVYAGLAFDFSFNPAHERFVIEQICRYIAHQQRLQLQRQATMDLRQSA